jgi:N-acetylneuraminic acid mutarotase
MFMSRGRRAINNRRDFLKGALAAGAVSALGGEALLASAVHAQLAGPGWRTRSWRNLASEPSSTWSTVSGPKGAWTGKKLIIFGGGSISFDKIFDYEPKTDTWGFVSATNEGRLRHSVLWAPEKQYILVWGGYNGTDGYLNTGLIYNPSDKSFSPTSTTAAPSIRQNHIAVWTGNHMLVWGGNNTVALSDGGSYDPVNNSWQSISSTNGPTARESATAVWTGTEMLVWGGAGTVTLNNGGRYNPTGDTWAPISNSGDAPTARMNHSAVWTGNKMIIWGGTADKSGVNFLNDGAIYDPDHDKWTAITTTGAPAKRQGHVAVWNGRQMLVWGGFDGSSGTYFNDGAAYDPIADKWSPLVPLGTPPAARMNAVGAWSPQGMFIFGGGAPTGLGDLYIYR